MSGVTLAVCGTGLVTAVGASVPASWAAMRAKLTNPSETRFADSGGEWIMAHQVVLEQAWRGREKLARMAMQAIDEALEHIPRDEWADIPLLLCVAEPTRPGRTEGLEDRLLAEIQAGLDVRFHAASATVAHGRVGVAVALSRVRELISHGQARRVLVVAVDSLACWPTLRHYERESRLLTSANSNGFMPGEGAGALLVGDPGERDALVVTGIGFGIESAHVYSDEPLRADGLSLALKSALSDAGILLSDVDFRITDLSGEQYYFKEATLALSRTLRQRKEAFDIWHPAESIGECGAVAGACVLIMAHSACRGSHAKGSTVLAHFSSDDGPRAAVICRWMRGQ
jgi:3-oxoacyl-[acyl-carrier-protein] synthase I